MKQITSLPTRKVNAATAAAAASEILIWFGETVIPNLAIPDSVESAITILLVFAAGYLTPPSSRDQIVPV